MGSTPWLVLLAVALLADAALAVMLRRTGRQVRVLERERARWPASTRSRRSPGAAPSSLLWRMRSPASGIRHAAGARGTRPGTSRWSCSPRTLRGMASCGPWRECSVRPCARSTCWHAPERASSRSSLLGPARPERDAWPGR